MSFLDNLESALNSLERGSEREDAGREQAKRESERARFAASALWAEKLRTGAFTQDVLRAAAREGHRHRTKVYVAWLGATLRLEARERKLEFTPASDGIDLISTSRDGDSVSRRIDLSGDATALVAAWLENK